MTEKITVEEYRAAYKKPPKFHNKIVEYKGYKFRSIGECERYKELELLELARYITDLKRQVKHDLRSNGLIVGTYTSDFEYHERLEGILCYIIEDFKGASTELFRLKWGIMQSMNPTDSVVFRITKKQRRRR